MDLVLVPEQGDRVDQEDQEHSPSDGGTLNYATVTVMREEEDQARETGHGAEVAHFRLKEVLVMEEEEVDSVEIARGTGSRREEVIGEVDRSG